MSRNRLWNVKNPYQGKDKKVLAVCSAGLLRSPTIAWVLSNAPYNFNTRACGADSGHALIILDEVLIAWADVVICVDQYIKEEVLLSFPELFGDSKKELLLWEIPDCFGFKDPNLIKYIEIYAQETFNPSQGD